MTTILRIEVRPGLALTRARIAAARATLSSGIPAALQEIGASTVQALGNAAPRGAVEGSTSPEGDADGPLAESFVAEMSGDALTGRVEVATTQPTKLRYVTHGTGVYGPAGSPIRPITKRALYWQGAPHPMRQVLGQRPNDFVSPTIDAAVENAVDLCDELAGQVADILNGEGGV